MTQEPKKQLYLRCHEGENHLSYLELADHPHELVSGIVAKTIELSELVPEYDGPQLKLDLDVNGRAIGIEILYSYDEFYNEE